MKATMRWLLAAILIAGSHLAAAAPDGERERAVFQQGWAAAARGDQSAVIAAISALPDYPLTPYLQFELFRQRVDQVPPEVMTRFLARHRDWSFHHQLKTVWLRSLGRRGQFDLLIEHAGDSGDTVVQCHLARARIRAGDADGLDEMVRDLWLVGHSQPDACNEAFAWWRRRGNPDADTAWRRFRLALEAGQPGLARYLKRYLPGNERPWADRWLAMVQRPHSTLRQAHQWQDLDHAHVIIRFGLERLAVSDWEAADRAWSRLRRQFAWPDAERASIERTVALFRAVALDAGAIDAIDALPDAARDEQILAWRARAAMAHGQWAQVLASIEAMPMRAQAQSRWRYWRGRALAELGRAQAALAYASLSAEADYYGFLAAGHLGQPFSLCEETLIADAATQLRMLRDAEFGRVLELLEVGLPWHARRTWQHLAGRLVAHEIEQAALIAAGRGWHHLAIQALNRIDRRQAYPWRFPMAAKGRVLAESKRHGVDPALAWGLMRAESAMQADARSPAGALGLLQLMPATARAVARRNELEFSGAGSLIDPDINIPLGIAHLGELNRELGGNWVHVAAAYNAGARALARWLEERPATAPDVWIETLPYYETRDYVPRVLAFATIYEWQLERPPELLARQIIRTAAPAAGFACPP